MTDTAGTPAPAPAPAPGERELRLALVCYGGVSLAVYMAGITREVQALVEASAALGTPAGDGLAGTHRAYADALARRSARDGVRTRVVVDTVAGTSAGGIDGLFLAKGLVTGGDPAPLRALWFEQGDIATLVRVRGPFGLRLPLGVRLATFAVRAALGRDDAAAPLDGDLLLEQAYRGLMAMNPAGGAPADRDQPAQDDDRAFDLFVTLTDVRGRVRSVTVTDGGNPWRDRTHRSVLRFRAPLSAVGGPAPGRPGQLGADFDGALAFAARATSSFPGAFPQVRIGDVERVLRKVAPDRAQRHVGVLEQECFADYAAEGEDPRLSWFFDGGVLDNYPFGHAIDAIQRKPARTEVERHLVVLQPDPGSPRPDEATADGRARAERQPAPGLLRTLLAGLVSVRLDEPVLDDLVRLRDDNDRITQVGRLVERLTAESDAAPGAGVVDRDSDYPALQAATARAHEQARVAAGAGWSTYADLRLDAVADLLVETVTSAQRYPTGSLQAGHLLRVLRLLVREVAGDDPDEEFWRRFDLGLRKRRLRATIQRVNRAYAGGDVARSALDATKSVLYSGLERLWELPGRVAQAQQVPEVLRAAELGPWLDRPAADLLTAQRDVLHDWLARVGAEVERALDGSGDRLWSALAGSLRPWPPGPAQTLVRTYVDFPLLDVRVFPLLSLSGVRTSSPVQVTRVSPVDAAAIDGSEDKLDGIGMRHFAAFLRRAYRENDYVWGRLDGAESMLRLVDPDIAPAELADALAAVVEQESDLAVLAPGSPLHRKLDAGIAALRH